ncbi:MAG: hypothetical protein ACRD9W_28945, partial [Terriglobia bacterium]
MFLTSSSLLAWNKSSTTPLNRTLNRRLRWDLAEALCFGCLEYRFRSFCCSRCFGITEKEGPF